MPSTPGGCERNRAAASTEPRVWASERSEDRVAESQRPHEIRARQEDTARSARFSEGKVRRLPESPLRSYPAPADVEDRPEERDV